MPAHRFDANHALPGADVGGTSAMTMARALTRVLRRRWLSLLPGGAVMCLAGRNGIDSKSRWRTRLIILLAISLTLSACGEDRTPVPRPDVHANRSIKQRYEIVVDTGTLPVHTVSGRAFFNINNNQECVKSDHSRAPGGIHNDFSSAVEFGFDKNENGAFTAILVGDPFQDADYFGRGVCHWEFTGAIITIDRGVPIQMMSLWRADLSSDGIAKIHDEYCAAEIQYAQGPPANFCVTNPDLLKKKIDHLYKVTTSNRRLSS